MLLVALLLIYNRQKKVTSIGTVNNASNVSEKCCFTLVYKTSNEPFVILLKVLNTHFKI